MKRYLGPISNNHGAAILAMVILIGVLCLIMFGVASMRLTAVAKQAYRVNEAFRFLNIMEEMGHAVGKAKILGDSVGTCPSGTTDIDIGGQQFCFSGSFAGINNFCINHTDMVGLDEDYCIQSITVGSLLYDESDSMYADLVIDVRAKQEPSIFKKIVDSIALNEANAACPNPSEPWRCYGTTPAPGGSYPQPPPVNTIPAPPPAASPPPSGAGSQDSDGTTWAGGNNMEQWMPKNVSWAPNNEIRTPMCTAASEEWLGCVRCANPNVTCITIRMCPPSNPGCGNPYAQRIAVY